VSSYEAAGVSLGKAEAIVERLRAAGARSVRALEGVEENMSFPLPRGLASVSV